MLASEILVMVQQLINSGQENARQEARFNLSASFRCRTTKSNAARTEIALAPCTLTDLNPTDCSTRYARLVILHSCASPSLL